MKTVVVAIQDLLPQPYLARAFGHIARSRRNWVRRGLIRLWMRLFDVALDEAARPRPEDYVSFEDFFTRELRPGARPQPTNPQAVASPADGFLQSFGEVRSGELIQAKGLSYPLGALLGDYRWAEEFEGGWYATVYLSPGDYHRVHAPCDSILRAATAIPGQAYSVTRDTATHLPGLYCRNERLVSRFETAFGGMALVMVGAMLVTGIQTVWRPPDPISQFQTTSHSLPFSRGEELGRFTLGSTLVLVFPVGMLAPDVGLVTGQRIRVGGTLGIAKAH